METIFHLALVGSITLLGVIALIVVVFSSFRLIGATEVGLVRKRFSFKKLTGDDPVALNGEPGYQADLLMPGLRFKLWPLYAVSKYPWVQVPAGEIGVVFSQVGEKTPHGAKSGVYKEEFGGFANLRTFIEKNGQKGVQRPVLNPGTLAPIHPVGFLVITKQKVYGLPVSPELREKADSKNGLSCQSFGLNPDQLDLVRIMPQPVSGREGVVVDMIGIVTTLEGDPLPPGNIANRLGDFDDVSKLESGTKLPAPEVVRGSAEASPETTLEPTLTNGPKDEQEDGVMDAEILEVVLGHKNTEHNNYQDFQEFLKKGGRMGLQHDPLLYGAYALNPFLIKVEQVPMLIVKQGEVAVIKSYVGLPTEDTSGVHFKFGSIVKPGHRGIWREPLRTGKYPINPRCYQAEIVPTAILTLNWAEATSQAHNLDAHLKQIAAKSKEGFEFSIDLQVQIHVPDKMAPKVISMVGTMLNLVNEVLQPAVGNHFRNKLQGMEAIKFIQEREVVQTTALEHITTKLKDYEVETRGVYIQDVILPTRIVDVLKAREVAVQQKETYEKEKEAQEVRATLETAKGNAEKQAELAGSLVGVDIAKNEADARVNEARGEAEYRQKVAAADGKGKAEGYLAQREAIGEFGTAVVNAIQALSQGQRFVPEVLVTSGGGGTLDGIIAMAMKYLAGNSERQAVPAATGPAANETTALPEKKEEQEQK